MSRWIDADKLEFTHAIARSLDDGHNWNELCITADEIAEAPSIDIVRCGECKWWIDNLTENDDDEAYDSCRWDWKRRIPTADDFCSYGEVRDE